MRSRRPGDALAGHAATSRENKPAGKTCANPETPTTRPSEGKRDACGKNSYKGSRSRARSRSRSRSKSRDRSRNRSKGKGKRERGRTLAMSSRKSQTGAR